MCPKRIILSCLILCSILQLTDVAVFLATVLKEMLSHILFSSNAAADLQKGLPLYIFLLHTEHLRQHFKDELKRRKVNTSSSETGFQKQERM